MKNLKSFQELNEVRRAPKIPKELWHQLQHIAAEIISVSEEWCLMYDRDNIRFAGSPYHITKKAIRMIEDYIKSTDYNNIDEMIESYLEIRGLLTDENKKIVKDILEK